MKKINVLNFCWFDAAGIFSKFDYFLNYYNKYFNSETIYFSSHPYKYIDYSNHLICNFKSKDAILKKIRKSDVIQFGICDWEHSIYRLLDIDFNRELVGKKVFFSSMVTPFILDFYNSLKIIEKHNCYIFGVIEKEMRLFSKRIKQINLPYPVLSEYLLKNQDFKYSENRKRIGICHSSTSDYIKSSFYIIKTVQELEKQYGRKICLFQSVEKQRTNIEILDEISKCDIYIDELWVLSLWGQSGIEASALGKPVLVYLDDDSIRYWKKCCQCEELPFVICSPENLYAKLEELINDKELRRDYSRKSHYWFWNYWASEKTAQNLYNTFKNMETFR